MCIHELWTYRDCGCQITHHIPCNDIHVCPDSTPTNSSPSATSEHRDDDSVLPSQSPVSKTHRSINKDSSLRTFPSQSHLSITKESLSLSTSTTHSHSPTPIDYTSASASNSNSDHEDNSEPDDDYHSHLRRTSKHSTLRPYETSTASYIHAPHDRNDVTRACSIKHTVHKRFLVPICEDCLMAEMGVIPNSEHALSDGEHGPNTDINDGGDEGEDEFFEVPRGRSLTRASHTSRQAERDSSTANDAGFANGDRLIWDSDVKVEITPSPPFPSPIKEQLSPDMLKGLAKSPAAKSGTLYPPSVFGANGLKRSNAVGGINLSRRRPWLVKELEAFLEKGGEKVDVRDVEVEEEADAEKAVFDSAVEVEVLESVDESGLEDGTSVLSALAVQDEGKSKETGDARRQFPSTHFSRSTSNLAAHSCKDPPRQPHTVSSLTTTTNADADADDESSLHTSSPLLFSRNKTKANTDSPHSPHPNAPTSPNIFHRSPLRPRSHTKTMRRRGMDIARSSFALRISSQWGSRERESLRGFKDDLMGRGERVRRDGGLTKEVVDIRQGRVDAEKERREKEETWKEVEEDAGRRGSVWSDDVLKSLEQVHVSDDTEFGDWDDPAEPPIIKLHRNDVLATPAREPDHRGCPGAGSPTNNLLTRFSQAQNGGKTWAKNVLGGLKRSLSRDSIRKATFSSEAHIQAKTHDINTSTEQNINKVINARGSTGVYNLRAVVAPSTDDVTRPALNASLRCESAQTESSMDQCDSLRTGSAKEGHIYVHPSTSTSDLSSTESESWQAHLAHDLAMPRSVKRHVLDSHDRSGVPRPPKKGFMFEDGGRASRTASFGNGLEPVPGAEAPGTGNWGASGLARRESAKRLLSSSTGPSVPVTASSSSSATWISHESASAFEADGWTVERLASIANSSDFEVDDGLMGNPCIDANAGSEKDFDEPNGFVRGRRKKGIQSQPRSRATTIDEDEAEDASDDSSQKLSFISARSAVTFFDATTDVVGTPTPSECSTEPLAQTERPRNPTPLSLPTFKFKPNLGTPAKKGLTQHPLSTELCINTPHRGEFASRKSSLGSHPTQTPTMVGMPPSFDVTFKSDTQLPATPASAPLLMGAAGHSSSEVGNKRANGTETLDTLTWNHSTTSNSTCIWNRYLCADECGRVAREEVESCGCVQRDFTGQAKKFEAANVGTRCRSTAPVVRYVDVDASAVEAMGDAEGSKVQISARSSQRCPDCESKA